MAKKLYKQHQNFKVDYLILTAIAKIAEYDYDLQASCTVLSMTRAKYEILCVNCYIFSAESKLTVTDYMYVVINYSSL